jgi:multidrug transporter EmrE-like cation transporter
MVSALRETGVIFAVIIGVVILKEPVNLSRIASITTTLVGAAILKLNRWATFACCEQIRH